MALRVGSRLGPYELLGLLGKGGMGEVYRARDRRLGRDVAVKVLPAALARDAARLRRFEHEARIAAGLGHPNLLTVYDVGTRRGALYLVTELLEGQTLQQRLLAGALPLGLALDYAVQVTRGLAAAHAKGIVHRDLKPENLFLTRDGRVKILDFGVAKLKQVDEPPVGGSQGETLTDPQAWVGTPGYMSPEQVRGAALDHRSDIFSFGAVLYEMLSARRAFRCPSVAETMHAILTEDAPPVHGVAPAVPVALERIVHRCLEKRCADRFQSAHDLGLALEALSETGQAVEGPPDGGLQPLGPRSSPREQARFAVADRAEGPREGPICVAREKELAKLEASLAEALGGRGRIAFVTGEAGTGKTVLASAFCQRAQETQPELVVASGTCNAHTGIGDPYLPFREILGLLTGDVESRLAAGSLSRDQATRLWMLLPISVQALVEYGPDLIDSFVAGALLVPRVQAWVPDGVDWLVRLRRLVKHRFSGLPAAAPLQASLFTQYARVIGAVAERRPLLLVVDDLQWADSGSVGLLFHLARQIAGSRVLLIGLYRPAEVALGRHGGRHPLEPVVHELQRLFGDVHVELGDQEDRPFVEALLDSEPNHLGHAFRQALFLQTRGHALFTVEMMRSLQEQGMLVKDAQGNWAEGLALRWDGLPARVEAVIAERIGRLEDTLQRLLEVATVEGEEFTAEVVARLAGMDAAEVVRLLSAELDRRHHLVRARGLSRRDGQRLSRYRFRHFLFQKYLYDRLDAVERARLHEEVGRTLEELYGGQTEAIAGELARHFEEAKIVGKAADHLLKAGQRATRASAYGEAAASLSKGLELLRSLPDGPERTRRELELQMSLGSALSVASGYGAPDVGRAFVRARELCRGVGDSPDSFWVASGLCMYSWCRGENAAALELAEQGLRMAQRKGDTEPLALARAFLGAVLCLGGQLARGRAHLEEALALFEPQRHGPLAFGIQDARQFSLSILARHLWLLGHPELALQRSLEAEAVARELSHAFTLAHASYFSSLVHVCCWDVRAAAERAESMGRLSEERGFPAWAAAARVLAGWCRAQEGHPEEAIAEMREGLAGWRVAGLEVERPAFLCLLAEAHAMAGRVEDGLELLDEALTTVEKTGERPYEAELNRVKGELLALSSDRHTEAEHCFRGALRIARDQGAKSWELRAATSLARLLRRQGRNEEARGGLAEVYGWFTEGFTTKDLKDARALLDELP